MDHPKSLVEFIRNSQPQIITQFEAFARTFSEQAASMTADELRDHASEMLTAIVSDARTYQTSGEQAEKSKGHGSAHAMEASGVLHADGRIRHGFTLAQVMAEFRALRASVLSLYDAEHGQADLTGIRRFNEAIDEALTASAVRYSDRVTAYRDQFVGMLGHDLRSPLGAITSGAALLSMHDIDAPQRQRVAAQMLRSASHMEAMIADLLDLTRSRLGGGIPIQPTPADFGEICAHAILESQAGHDAGTIAYEQSGDLHGCWDVPRLMQVVTNLLQNALEHGAGKPVRAVAAGSTNDVVLRVSNAGSIPADALATIFEPFVRHQFPDGRTGGGLGLGLYIVHTIVTAHQGTVTVTSSEAAGTVFEVHLPRTQKTIPSAR